MKPEDYNNSFVFLTIKYNIIIFIILMSIQGIRVFWWGVFMLANYHLTNYYLNLFCIISSVIFIILEFKFLVLSFFAIILIIPLFSNFSKNFIFFTAEEKPGALSPQFSRFSRFYAFALPTADPSPLPRSFSSSPSLPLAPLMKVPCRIRAPSNPAI